jgi:hypothetical protein
MKKNIRLSTRLTLLASVCFVIVFSPVFAADPLVICQSGQPFLWPSGGANIPFNPDQGDLGPLMNAQAVALVQQAFDRWGNLPTTSASFFNAGPLPVDVDITNFLPYLNAPSPDGLSAIVFDDTGEIFDLLYGPGSGILGFAGPEWGYIPTCEILEGYAFLNGPEFTNLQVAEDIMVHEFGHYINLAHVELNGQLVGFSEGGDTSGPTPDSTTFGMPASFDGTEVIETMYPFLFSVIDQGTRTPHADDIASISTLYPAPTFFATTGSISGTIFAPSGTTRLSGVNVIARNLNNPFIDAVSAISGGFTDSTSQSDPVVGTFTLNGLTPGQPYILFIDNITAAPGRFSTPALFPLPGPEEYWNGANESRDPDIDDPLAYEMITAVAGSPASGINIIFNQPLGVIPLGDDDSAEIFLPFTFEICGQRFDSVFVNSNGNLTFGSGDTDWTESAAELLSDQPRIAALWDDLNPSAGGVVSYSQNANRFSVRFENVPEYSSTGANTFEITLKKAADHIDIVYGNITAQDGLAGVSGGGKITSGFETESDLSSFSPDRINLHNQPAMYEVFSYSDPSDLADSTVRFNGTTDYNDNWAEPNNSLNKARKVKIPFDTTAIQRFSEIEPTGGDVDYYRFTANAGQSLIAEIIGGTLDTVLGVFDEYGNLIEFDDDGGTGLLSKAVVELPVTGEYTLAVTTYPDFDFNGDGYSGGRYVLDVFALDGILLELGDDNYQQVNLGFTFPFQGQDWTSVFVNSNGSLTFGAGDSDWSESVSEFLAESPRIAPLWDDLSPNNGGQVIANRDTGTFTVSFIGVPEFISTGANSFSVTLRADGSVTIEYGLVSANDGLVGLTEGGFAANPGETDLSAATSLSVVGTTYELFIFGDPFDLALSILNFLVP